MTQTAATLSYASPKSGVCPLCHDRPTWKKTLYGHPVCKKCYYRFANRRQLAYLVDAVIFAVVVMVLMLMSAGLYAGLMTDALTEMIVLEVIGLAAGCVFIMKDGFNGQSPGKWLTDVQVLDEHSGQPISFGQSFKRNMILLLGHVPVIGPLASLVVVITLAIQLNKGYRTGDRFANTRVIWKRYARSPVFGGDGMLCASCGYDLTGNDSGVCPECGTAVPESDRNGSSPAMVQPIG